MFQNLCYGCDKIGAMTYFQAQSEIYFPILNICKIFFNESDLWDTVDWGKKWLVDFSAGKKSTSFSFDRSNNTGAIDVKMDGSFLEENSAFKMLRLTFSSKLDWGSYIISIAKTASKKIRPWFVLWSFLLLRLLYIFINLSYAHVWNTVVISGLVLLVAT